MYFPSKIMRKNWMLLIAGEPGEFIGKIVSGDPLKEFNGYRDKVATDKVPQ